MPDRQLTIGAFLPLRTAVAAGGVHRVPASSEIREFLSELVRVGFCLIIENDFVVNSQGEAFEATAKFSRSQSDYAWGETGNIRSFPDAE